MGKRFGGFAGQCPVAERISKTLLRLPLFSGLTDEEQERVLNAIFEFKLAAAKTMAAAGAA
jgi:dTDP-4-amino-4,6-dideoxygalactose transaminase